MKREINDGEQKDLLIDILIAIDEFCQKHNIRYFLNGGTLLGAVRHQGFIPWDDDIDVAMPREDYDKFVSTFNLENDRYRIVNEDNTKNYYLAFSKLVDTRTILKENTDSPIELGVYIDIFPLDKMGRTYEEACYTNNKIKPYRRMLSAKTYKKHNKRKWYNNILSTIFGWLPVTRYQLIKKIQNMAKSYSFNECNYIGIVVMMTYGEREILESKWYEEQVKLPFEGHLFCAPKEYDKVLTSFYGDYMTPPPKEKQVTHHDMKAWLIED